MPPIDFNKLIDQHVYSESWPKKTGRYYPSSIGQCLRKQWFSFRNPKEAGPELLKVFEAGNLMHDFIVDVLKSEKTPEVELLESEVPIKYQGSGFLVSGRVDDLILVKANRKKLLLEVKSTKDIRYTKAPQAGHIMQLQFYLHAMDLKEGVILYIEKNTLQTRQFHVKYSKGQAYKILRRFETLHKSLAEDKIPRPEAREKKWMAWMCGYCEYAEECKNNLS